MRKIAGFVAVAVILGCAQAAADPVVYQPEGCDFAVTFSAPPKRTLLKTLTNRGDAVLTYRAELQSDAAGKLTLLRAECTAIPRMGFVDDQILKGVMDQVGKDEKLKSPRSFFERNKLTGTVGRLRGRREIDSKDVTVELRRYFGDNTMLDVWIGAETDAYPPAEGDAFLKTITLKGKSLF